jgi:formate dehydrogenase major subunit
MKDKISLKINGQQIQANPDQTILEIVREKELDNIPTLCHSPELKPYGSCFLCVVEVKGRKNLLPSCATRVAEGMEIETGNERIKASRKTALELLLSNHYADCQSPCMEGCPAGVDAQGYIALAAMGEEKKAVELIRQANPLPAVCGRVCVRACEVVCRRQEIDETVSINWVKRYATDHPGVYDDIPAKAPSTGQTIAIVGSGPAGLTAAYYLGLKGHHSVIYEALEKTGGMLRYGIPSYRLPDSVMDKEVDFVCRAGAEIKTLTKVGVDISMDELQEKHDAIFIGAGAMTGKAMRVDGEFETEGVVAGVDFLRESIEKPKKLSGTAVVVGGGNTAMDAARTAWRVGADKVIVLYRRTRAEMPADAMEIVDLLEETVELMELAAPIGIVSENGKLKALKCIRMKLGEPDASGRRRPVTMEGSEFELPCQLAISAIGQDTVLDGLEKIENNDIELSRWKTYIVNTNTMETNVKGVWAGGDNADDGPTVAIEAIRDGQRAARSIHSYLSGEEMEEQPFVVRKSFWAKPGKKELGDISESQKHELALIEVEDRKLNFKEVATGFEFEDVVHEEERCLSCGCVRFEDCDLRLYGQEYKVDMDHLKGYARQHKVDSRHPYVIIDPNKCILCSRCIRTCERVLPVSALGLVNRGFRTEVRPAMNDALAETNCISCGNCVDSCPTGSLSIKNPFPGYACMPYEEVSTNCAFCSLGCGIRVRKYGDKRFFITSSGVPGEYLCRHGRFGNELFAKLPRLTESSIREGAKRTPARFKDACRDINNSMRKAVSKYGADKVAVFVSPDLTNEELYLASRLAREGLGSNNIASLSLLNTKNEAAMLDGNFGFSVSTSDRTALHSADLIICNNTALNSEHLILGVEVMEAARNSSKLVVCNSTLDPADELLSTLNLDPMRGRAAILWNGITKLLLKKGILNAGGIEGEAEFNASLDFSFEDACRDTGLEESKLEAMAELISQAKNIVIVHNPDRVYDHADGDLVALGNLLALCRKADINTQMLLPRNESNAVGVELMGADPAFITGRKPAQSLPGSKSRQELRKQLANGEIRAAIIIGEDPMRYDKTAAYFQNVEFMAAIDWTQTETTQFADVTLASATFLESAGTRCNFEGKLLDFKEAVKPLSGRAGWQVLTDLLVAFGMKSSSNLDEISTKANSLASATLAELKPFYMNTGENRPSVESKLQAVSNTAGKLSIALPLSHSAHYKRKIREMGTEHYRVN